MDLKRELTDYEIGGIGDIKKHALRFHSYRIGTESGNFQVGQCYFFEGGALRVAKVKNGKITQIEVIRSKNAPVVLKR